MDKMMKLNFNLSEQDRLLVSRIADRAVRIWNNVDATSLSMDLTVVHNHIYKLRLAYLLAADDFNFAHDVAGIVNNLDRRTLTMRNCFLPRFTA